MIFARPPVQTSPADNGSRSSQRRFTGGIFDEAMPAQARIGSPTWQRRSGVVIGTGSLRRFGRCIDAQRNNTATAGLKIGFCQLLSRW